MENNVKDTALIFEGGGMRASYTSGILNNLLEHEIYFDYVAGISAGSSHTVNYISRDVQRAKQSFVDLVLDPKFGGWGSFLKGEGYFRAQYLYEETTYPGATLPFNFDAFRANPARLRVGAFRQDSGEMVYFTKDDMTDVARLMRIVRSSSSIPIFMPPTEVDGYTYVDGGMGGGIALDIAKQDGFKKFFVVLSRERGFKMKPAGFKGFLKAYYRRHPLVAQAMIERYAIYNRTLEELAELERQGRAYLVYPDVMPVSNREKDFEKLSESYRLGYAQGKKDAPRWKEFLGIK
ncbi:MAG: patatin family protein [Eubacteriales bacterium]